jgi:5-methyltetrahydropteroyltriglutamate--homocysteine methyltransferase
MRRGYQERGSDVDEMIDRTIELDNALVDGFDRLGVAFGLHICRGNNQSMFYASGGYDPIAERVFRRTRFDRFLLEYDDERSGTFEPLRFVPEDRVVVLGLVTTKKPRLETPSELEGRIEAAARLVPLERLALSPQCGFASTWEGNRISPEVQRQKLEVVARTARSVWGEPGQDGPSRAPEAAR